MRGIRGASPTSTTKDALLAKPSGQGLQDCSAFSGHLLRNSEAEGGVHEGGRAFSQVTKSRRGKEEGFSSEFRSKWPENAIARAFSTEGGRGGASQGQASRGVLCEGGVAPGQRAGARSGLVEVELGAGHLVHRVGEHDALERAARQVDAGERGAEEACADKPDVVKGDVAQRGLGQVSAGEVAG